MAESSRNSARLMDEDKPGTSGQFKRRFLIEQDDSGETLKISKKLDLKGGNETEIGDLIGESGQEKECVKVGKNEERTKEERLRAKKTRENEKLAEEACKMKIKMKNKMAYQKRKDLEIERQKKVEEKKLADMKEIKRKDEERLQKIEQERKEKRHLQNKAAYEKKKNEKLIAKLQKIDSKETKKQRDKYYNRIKRAQRNVNPVPDESPSTSTSVANVGDEETLHDVISNEVPAPTQAVAESEVRSLPDEVVSALNEVPTPTMNVTASETGNVLNIPRVVVAQNRSRISFFKCAVSGTLNATSPSLHFLGALDRVCTVNHCQAVHFAAENGRLKHSCCHAGKVSLISQSQYPDEFKALLTGNSANAKNFRKFIRQYNNASAFASFGAKVVDISGRGPFCLKISGEICHLTSTTMEPRENEVARYAQLYVYDSDTAVNLRMNHPANANCFREIMSIVDTVIRQISPYAGSYQNLRTAVEEEEARYAESGGPRRNVSLLFSRSSSDDQRRYNAPTSPNDVGMVFVSDTEGNLPAEIDIAVYPRDSPNSSQRISMLSPNLDSMVFPLLFPSGECGWSSNLQHHPDFSTRVHNNVTLIQFYSHKIAIRRAIFNSIHYSGKLFQQYIVNAYVRCESSRLTYLRLHQQELRVECYQGLLDHLNNRHVDSDIRAGNVVILPSTFIGSPRHMTKLYQDSMAVVRKYGRPDLFITFTCNPKWREIVNELHPWQNASDRPDLVARVFQLKVLDFICDVVDRQIFGKILTYVYVIEEQKRGLPHLHGLFTLADTDKIFLPADIDNVVSAELPDKERDRYLYDAVLKHNIHGPCGLAKPEAICMVDGKCSKRFPKAFHEETEADGNGYPVYKRRDNSAEDHLCRNVKVDNRFVVPYNPYLTRKFNAHINVESCSSVAAIKYIHKYISKGHDCARMEIRLMQEATDSATAIVHDEISQFLDCRFISAPEAAWRILENPIHGQSHTIILLGVHLPGGEQVYFREGNEEEAIALSHTTTLTGWFNLNQIDDSAHSHLYQDIPNFFVFKNKIWKKRQRGGDKVIGRIVSVSPRKRELYHLRILLLEVKGATSYEHLRTVNGVVLPTFSDAARELGLTDNVNEWVNCLQEGAVFMMPKALRNLFVVILIHCTPSDPLHLWNTFKSAMSEDFLRNVDNADLAVNLALLEISDALLNEGSSCTAYGLPEPDRTTDTGIGRNADDVNDENLAVEMQSSLNIQQREVFDSILQVLTDRSAAEDATRCFFLDGAGGSGKTFLYKTLVHSLQSQGMNVLSVAWTGIAAILIPGGRTCHTAFNLPLNFNSSMTCRISKKNKILIRNAQLILWDEAPMAPLIAFEMIERAIRDIMHNELPFGGKVVVLGGDFRQVLPVCRRASRGKIVASSIKRSTLWRLFKIIRLNINMRTGSDQTAFAEWLLELGNGTLPSPPGCVASSIILPASTICQDVISTIYGDSHSAADANILSDRAILCPKNSDARIINEKVLEKLEGPFKTFKSIDSARDSKGNVDPEEQVKFPVEFLNSFNPPGLPPHALNLKIGAIVMLLRNISLEKGLCNGTRLIVKNFSDHVLQVEIITGDKKGSVQFLPRITLDTSGDVTIPFNLYRRQFPVQLAYGMTINKSQGQTFNQIGVFLQDPVFGHGQLYVACSRVRSENALKIQIVNGARQGVNAAGVTTQNIVYREILD